jgi:hypothetical protein
MKHTFALLGFSLVIASTRLVGQATTPAELQATVLHSRVSDGDACPIAMRARHEARFHKELAKGAKPDANGDVGHDGSAMQIRLTLTNPNLRKIVAALVTVHGSNGDWQWLPTGSRTKIGEVSKTIEVSFDPGQGADVDAFLALRGFTTVSFIALNSVTYADGSMWTVRATNACQVAPDPLMLIAAQ